MKICKMLTAFFLMTTVLLGCTKKADQKESQYTDALSVLQVIADAYSEEDRFSMAGGDMEHAVMDAPGSFDISKKEELMTSLHLPEAWLDKIENCASMVHMMNANTFTAAAYKLKNGSDGNRFADDWMSELNNVQWVCGQPETVLVMQVDQYVITAFGADDLMQTFKKYAQSSISDLSILSEQPLVQ